MKRRKHERERKRTRNPASLVPFKPEQLAEAIGDSVIMNNFGLFGLAISSGSPKLREFLIRCSVDPESVPSGTTEPASAPESTPKQK
jgi:hypothetical protein